MYNTKEKESTVFKNYFESILTYIDIRQPDGIETLEFIGALMYSVVDKLNMTEKEKDDYIECYNRLIRKSLIKKKTKKANKKEACLI